MSKLSGLKKAILYAFLFVSASAAAQFVQPPASLRYKGAMPARPAPAGDLRSGGIYQVSLDYDSFDNKYALTNPQPDTLLRYPWSVNAYNDTSLYFNLNTAIQVYDTLADVNNNFAGPPLAGATITIDSFMIPLSDSNASFEPDTFIVSIFDPNLAAWNGLSFVYSPLWTDTIYMGFVNYFASTQQFTNTTFYPNLTLAQGGTFGIKVDFYGPESDQLYLLASYRESCGSTYDQSIWADSNMLAPHNSAFYVNYGMYSGFLDYGSENQFVTGTACPFFILQNFLFYPYLTVSSPDTTVGIHSPEVGITDFNVYPDPSGGVFNIAIEFSSASDAAISIADVTGGLVYQGTGEGVTTLDKRIDLSGLAPGIYIVTIRTDSGVVNRRLVIE